MQKLADLLREIEETCNAESHSPFPYEDVEALSQVFGGIRMDLADAGLRYRARVWLSKRSFDRFPMYRFLEQYDLSEYAALHHELELAERLRQMLLDVIHLYEVSARTSRGGCLLRVRPCSYPPGHRSGLQDRQNELLTVGYTPRTA